MGSFCSMMNRSYLAQNFPNLPVNPIKVVPHAYDNQPICAIQGTVDLNTHFTGWDLSATVYVVGPGHKSLIG